jgi:hypothetical protein
MLKTTVIDVVLTSSFAAILPAIYRDNYTLVQVKAPPGGLLYKFNSDSAFVTMVEGEMFQHPLFFQGESLGCKDVIYMKTPSTRTVQVEIHYY